MPDPPPAPPLTLDFEDAGSSVIVRCHGRLIAGITDLLYAPVSRLILTHERIILDLSDLTHMDSMGLGSLVRLYVSASSQDCTVELLNLGAKVRNLLVMTNLISVFSLAGEPRFRM